MDESKKKILIVDDDEITINIYSVKLREEGLEVLAARDGQEAWEIIQSGQIPDIIFTGIVMPRMNGFELIEKLHADPKLTSIPVAVFSHRNRPEDRERAEKLGVDDFIARDFTAPVEVIRRLKLLFGVRKKFKIAFLTDRYESRALINLFNKQEGTNWDFNPNDLAILELEPEKEAGKFLVRLTGEKEAK